MSITKYEVVEIDHAEITVDVSMLGKSGRMYFNATEMARSYGKSPRDWLKLKEANAYIQALLDVRENHNGNYDSLVKTRRGGKYQGTWMHNDLAIVFARWLDVKFAVQMDLAVKRMLEEERQRHQARLEAKTGFLPLTNAVQAAHDNPQWFHYANEMKLLCKLATGLSPKQLCKARGVQNARDGMCASELADLTEMEMLNAALIKRGISYAERKEWLHGLEEAA